MSRTVHEDEPEADEDTASKDGKTARRGKEDGEKADDQEHAEGRKKPNDGKKEGEDEGESKGFHPAKKTIVIGVIVLAVLLIAALFWWLHARQFVKTDDAYTTGHVHQISARIAGTVEEVRVDDNQAVRANDVLVRLDPRDYEVSLAQARASREQALAQVSQAEAKIAQNRAQSSAASAQAAQAKSQLVTANSQLEKARADYERIAGLYTKDIKAVAKADVDAATEAFNRARSAVEGARANLASAQAQVEAADANVKASEADAQVARASVATSDAQVKQAELQLSYCNVLAPVNGKVSKKTVERGQRLTPGQALMAIVPQDVWVIANLKETQLDRLEIGQRVDVEIDALKHRTFFGHVDSIQEGSGATFSLLPPDNATGNFTKIVQRVPVKIVFDPESIRDFREKIVPGLSVEPKIDLESLRDGKREPKRQKREEKQNRDAESGK